MLRRVGLILVIAGLGAVLGLPLLRAASAAPVAARGGVRLVGAGGGSVQGQWQSWANASRVPTVTGAVTLRLSGCPGLPKAAGCVYTRQPRVVYLKPELTHPRAVMLHELGHVYDLTVFSNSDRGKFRRIMKATHTRWWLGKRPLAEWFAEAYSWCARYSKIVSVEKYAIYEYDPTPNQHRDTCALIKHAARDHIAPDPPTSAPIVTGDPAPPAAPPSDTTIVPGSTSDPGPVKPALPSGPLITVPVAIPTAVISDADLTPTPTASPSPTPTRTP